MKQNKIYGLILAISMLIFSGCGNDTKENPPPPEGAYSFFNATTPLEIKKAAVDENGTVIENEYTVAVQLLKHGLVASGEIVQMLPFDLDYGFVTDLVVETTTNGYAVFTYFPPEGSDYDKIKGQDVTITAVYEEPIDENENVVVDPDAPPVILLTQDFLLQFR